MYESKLLLVFILSTQFKFDKTTERQVNAIAVNRLIWFISVKTRLTGMFYNCDWSLERHVHMVKQLLLADYYNNKAVGQWRTTPEVLWRIQVEQHKQFLPFLHVFSFAVTQML